MVYERYHPYWYDGLGERRNNGGINGVPDEPISPRRSAQNVRPGYTMVRMEWWSGDLFVGYYVGWVHWHRNGEVLQLLFHQDASAAR